MNSFLVGVIALLNVPSTGVIATAGSPTSPQDEVFIAQAYTPGGEWADTKLEPGTGTSRVAKAEDLQIADMDGEETVVPPVLDSWTEADPDTEIVLWEGEVGETPSNSFLNYPTVPIAVWAETKLYPPPPPKPQPKPTRSSGSSRSSSGSSSSTPYYVNNPPPVGIYSPAGAAHRFPWGQCTWWVAQQRKIVFRGNAKEWPRNSRAAGHTTGQTPMVGAVIVTTESWYGHVGYVEKVEGNKVYFSEMNYAGLGIVSRRWMSTGDSRFVTFIY